MASGPRWAFFTGAPDVGPRSDAPSRGILFTDAVLDYSASNGPHEDQMEFFGSVYLHLGGPWVKRAVFFLVFRLGWEGGAKMSQKVSVQFL